MGRLMQRCRKGAGGVEKSILVHKEGMEDAISAQRRHICRRIMGLEQVTRYSKVWTSNSGGKRETGERRLSIFARGSGTVMVLWYETLVSNYR